MHACICAAMEHRPAVGLPPWSGSTPDDRIREEPEPCDRSARGTVVLGVQGLHLRGDVHQRLPDGFVTSVWLPRYHQDHLDEQRSK